jgi:alanine-synthesizing transaminase
VFSPRVPRQLDANAFSRALGVARAAGRELIDLTISNPTRAGITYPEGLFAGLASQRVAHYAPEPLGLLAARQAVVGDYARRGVTTTTDRIVLTASTSEAYSILFKLLCAPAVDAVLVPVPSYPLFEHLTRLDGVDATAYSLHYDGRWWVDFDSVDRMWTAQTRAVLAVSPNNPTGSLLSAEETRSLAERCASRNAALIVDEVFVDYPLAGPESPSAPIRDAALLGDLGGRDNPGAQVPAASLSDGSAGSNPGELPCLTFRLGGLSKSAALPQLKLGWIAIDGPDMLVAEALARLEFICDTYLSVSTPVQIAAPALIAGGAGPRAQVIGRVRANYAALHDLCAACPTVDVLHADAGWSAVLRVAATASEEEMTLDLLERDGVIVYPGFFFDFPREAFLIVSLLPEPRSFAAGVKAVLERIDV